MNNNYESVADLLKKEEQKNIKPIKVPKVRATKVKAGTPKRSKKFIVTVTALVTAAVIGLTSGVAYLVSQFKKKNDEDLNTSKTTISAVDITDMGTELEFPKENKTSKYGKTTGNVDVDKIVEKDGKIYVDKQSADKSDQVGNVSIDTKNDTLIVDKDGKVKEKTEEYEIKDDKGNTVQKGELDDSGIPDGYAWDPVLKKYVEKEEVGKYVYADATYYNEEGNILLEKGQITTKTNLEYVKQNFSTTKSKKETNSSNTSSTTSSSSSNTSSTTSSSSSNTSSKTETSSSVVSDEGKVNVDGTYTIFGLTFRTKADYQQWILQGYEGYAEADGIMMPEEEIIKQNQKVK